MSSTTIDRADRIAIILHNARRPCPPIVPARMMLHKPTGNRFSVFGVPLGIRSTDLEPIHVGYVFSDPRNGTTYGTRSPSEKELRDSFEKSQDVAMARFREELESADDDRFNEKWEFWSTRRNA